MRTLPTISWHLQLIHTPWLPAQAVSHSNCS
jgi:hypothetical protein